MRIRLGQLRRLVREAAISPAFFKNLQPVRDIMDRPNIANAVAALEQPFRTAVEANLALEARDEYDPETGQLDDATYERIKQHVDRSTEVMMAMVQKAITQAWARAQRGDEAAESGVQQKRAVA